MRGRDGRAKDSGAVHSHPTALLILDMLNTFDFPGSAALAKGALAAAREIAGLKRRLKRRGVPAIYVNNNLGQWRSDWKEVYRVCAGSRGKEVAALLKPEPDDYFVLKPKNSGFYCTTLELLLRELGARRLVVTGVATDICVLFTAHDAHARGYEVTIPRDCVAANTPQDTSFALGLARKVSGARTAKARSV